MAIHYVLREYSMSEINFEAIGRCQHLKSQFMDLKARRDRMFSEVRASYTESMRSLPDSVYEFEVNRVRALIDKIDAINIELMTTVDEFNKWAKEANLPQLNIIRSTQIPS